jgi:hypothetical protein
MSSPYFHIRHSRQLQRAAGYSAILVFCSGRQGEVHKWRRHLRDDPRWVLYSQHHVRCGWCRDICYVHQAQGLALAEPADESMEVVGRRKIGNRKFQTENSNEIVQYEKTYLLSRLCRPAVRLSRRGDPFCHSHLAKLSYYAKFSYITRSIYYSYFRYYLVHLSLLTPKRC